MQPTAMPTRTTVRPALLVLVLVTTQLWSLTVHAQSSNADRDRTALRRAQAALQQAQQARDALEAEARTQTAARNDAEGKLARLQAEQTTLRRDLAEARAALAAAQTAHAAAQDADRQRQTQADATRAAEESTRAQAWRAQLADSQRQGEERRAANAALVQQLAARTAALADAERRVQALHAMGGELLLLYRDKGRLEQALVAEPVLGLGAVRQDERIVRLQDRLDQLRQPAPAPAGTPQ